MGKGIERLSALAVSRERRPGLHSDGGGLYLQVGKSGSKSWVFRYRIRKGLPQAGRLREMGLGSLNAVSLSDAREAARSWRKLLQDGKDPIEARAAAKAFAADAGSDSAMTFRQCAAAYIEAHKPSWQSSKHAKQWEATINAYAVPVFGDKAVQDVDTRLVMKILSPIWHKKRETASRVRGRIEAILDWAAANGYRDGDNPARWKGKIDMLLPGRTKTSRVKHHPALPYDEIPSFMSTLRDQPGVAAAALEFAILTAARTSEVLGASWSEVNFSTSTWVIPANRMKAGREHRIPLSNRTVCILKVMEKLRIGEAVFPSSHSGKHLSNMAMLSVLKRMGRSDLTTHGFRSTFRDWAAEKSNFQREVAEMALAHAIGSAVEAAYRRGDLFEKRRQLMEAWSSYCDLPPEALVLQMADAR